MLYPQTWLAHLMQIFTRIPNLVLTQKSKKHQGVFCPDHCRFSIGLLKFTFWCLITKAFQTWHLVVDPILQVFFHVFFTSLTIWLKGLQFPIYQNYHIFSQSNSLKNKKKSLKTCLPWKCWLLQATSLHPGSTLMADTLSFQSIVGSESPRSLISPSGMIRKGSSPVSSS